MRVSSSIAAFHKDLTDAGQADRVAVLTFSEFGRRVAENASAGTDHGAAAPLFVVGPVKKAGLVGTHPSFDDLDDGDLKHHTDFRRVYASLLDWMGVPSARSSAKASAPAGSVRGERQGGLNPRRSGWHATPSTVTGYPPVEASGWCLSLGLDLGAGFPRPALRSVRPTKAVFRKPIEHRS